jgi:2-keto-4-pentenoate hydratase
LSTPEPSNPPELAQIASRFVAARRAGVALPDYPGHVPQDLLSAYAVQDLAIAQWPDRLVGWKVGYIAPERRDPSGDERLLGPMFARALWQADGGRLEVPVFQGGFAAVEAEYVLRLEADAPDDKLHWTPDEAASLASTLLLGIEIASSPLATINALGPCVVVSDFGNHAGLVLGPEIRDWQHVDESLLHAETWIDGQRVGIGGAARLPGGVRGAFAFALGRSARRGRPLKAGDLIATGNATGIHDIRVGQRAEVRFLGQAELACEARAATAAADVVG